MPHIEFKLSDWRDYTCQFEDHFFDLAIADPPYFSGPERRNYYGRKISATGFKRKDYGIESECWQRPDAEYFKELKRVSKHQIIWGINYFDVYLGSGRIIWDKLNGDTSFSDAEIAYWSLHDSVRVFRYKWNGMMQGSGIYSGHIQQGNKKLNQDRIHPTEKPIDLYGWLLLKYAKPGFKILDTHLGSGSIMQACDRFGADLYACEKSEQVFDKCATRWETYLSKKRNSIFEYSHG